jgi:hypothetical protein
MLPGPSAQIAKWLADKLPRDGSGPDDDVALIDVDLYGEPGTAKPETLHVTSLRPDFFCRFIMCERCRTVGRKGGSPDARRHEPEKEEEPEEGNALTTARPLGLTTRSGLSGPSQKE